MEILKPLSSIALILLTSLLLFQDPAYSAPSQTKAQIESSEKIAALKQVISAEKYETILTLYNKIELGMTLEEVESILGNPGLEMNTQLFADGKIATNYAWFFDDGTSISAKTFGTDGIVFKTWCCL